MHRFATRRLLTLALTIALLAATVAVPPVAVAASAPLIVIDPGHGGPYSNANANGLREETVNLQIALELRSQLQARGYRVVMTRTTDRAVTLADIPTWNLGADGESWYFTKDGHRGIYKGIPKDDLQARCNVANREGADLFISIHNNGSADRAARGTETIASSRDPLGTKLAAIVHRRVVARTGLRDRGVKSMDLYVCRWTNTPAILVEGAFITNPSDAYKLKQRWFRRRIALGIAEGVQSWLGERPVTRVYPRTIAPSSVTSSPAVAASAMAVAASRAAFPDGAPVAVVARPDRWLDAATAPALARRLGGPLLWVAASGPDTETATELGRLGPDRLVLVGVEGSFDESLTAALVSTVPTLPSGITTLSASSRSELAASIATTLGPASNGEVFLIDENDSGGLLTVAPIAARRKIPVLLARDGALPPESLAALEALSPSRVVLAGSPTQLPEGIAPGLEEVRVDGRYVTLRADYLNQRYYRASTMRPIVADCGSGAEYLTAASHAARSGNPVIPVTKNLLPTYTRHWIVNRRPAIAGFEVFDGRGAIGARVDRMLQKADR